MQGGDASSRLGNESVKETRERESEGEEVKRNERAKEKK